MAERDLLAFGQEEVKANSLLGGQNPLRHEAWIDGLAARQIIADDAGRRLVEDVAGRTDTADGEGATIDSFQSAGLPKEM